MSNQIELGIRVSVDGQSAIPAIERIGGAAQEMAGQVQQAGRAMATELEAGANAATRSAEAVSVMAESEAAATERIRAMVAASIQQNVAVVEAASSIDQSATSTRRAAEENANYTRSLAAVTAQMSQPQATNHSSATASEESLKFVAALQRQYDMLGKNAAELAQMETKLLGGTKATQAHAYALASETEALRARIAAEERSGQAADNFIAKLREQTATLGMNRTQLLSYQAAQLGVADAAAPMITKLAEAGAGARSAGGHVDGLSLSSVGARRELLVLAHELSQGNFQKFGGSMMVLGEQTGAASLLFSAAGITALSLAAAVGGVTYEIIKGYNEQKHMNDALIMTGNYAGLTSDSLNGLAHAAVDAGGSIGEAKKVATELANSGKFTGEQIGFITDATVAWEHATGKSTKEIIKDFESLAVQTQGSNMRATEAVSKATLKLDDTYHFLTESVFEQIRALEKEGNAKAASALATETFAKATKDRSEEIVRNLGSIAKGWNSIKEVISGAIDGLNQFGARATPASNVSKYSLQLQRFDEGVTTVNNSLGRPSDQMSADTQAARLRIVTNLTHAVEELNKVDAEANATAARRVAESEASHAASRILQDDMKLEKRGMTELQVALREYGQDLAKVAAANPDSAMLSQEAVNSHMAALIKAHSAPVSMKGQDSRAKELENALANERAELDGEKSIYDARDKMLAQYHQKFGLSDAEFYAGRTAARADYMASEAISYAKELGLVQASITSARNPKEVEAARGKYDQLVAAHKKFVDDMRNAGGDDAVGDAAAAQAKYTDTIKAIQAAGIAENKQLDDAIAKQKLHNAEIGKSKDQIELAKQAAIDLDTAQLQSDADFIRNAINREGFDKQAEAAYTMRLNFLDQEIAKRKELSGQLAAGAVLEADSKAAKAASTAWDGTAKHVEQTLADAIANGGGNAWKKLKTSFVSQALNIPLHFIGGSVASALNPGAAQAGGTNLLGMAGNVSSLYNAATGAGLSGMIGTAGTGIATVGNAIGSSTMSAFGAGFADTGAATMMTASETFAQAGMAAEASAASLGSAFSAAVPWVGAALAAYAVWNKFFEDGPESDTRLTFASNNAVGNINNNERGESWAAPYIGNGTTSSLGTFGVKSTFWMDPNQEVVQSFLKTVGQTDDALAAFMTTAEKASVSTYLTDKSYTAHTGTEGSNPNASGQLDAVFTDRINNILEGLQPGLSSLESGFTGTSQQLASEVAALLSYRVALKDSGQVLFGAQVTLQDIAALKQPTEATSAALTRVVNEFQATNQLADMFGVGAAQAFGADGLESEAARAQLILLSGGLSTFASQASDYAQNYQTEAERLAPVAKELDAALGNLGLSTIPETRDQFKALIDLLVSSGELATEQGAKQYAGLMSLEGKFAQVHTENAAAAKIAADALASINADYQKQIDDLTKASMSLADQRALEVKGMDASTLALYSQREALQAQAKAVADATATIGTIGTARQGIADQMFEAVLGGKDLAGKVAMLKSAEADLWKQVGTDAESATVLEKIRSLSMTRIGLEDQLHDKTISDMRTQYSTRKDALTAELGVMQHLHDYARQLMDFTAGLKTGDLSPLNPQDKLGAARDSYTAMLSRAQDGDATAMSGLQGAAQAYLQLDKQYYGSTAEYASTFSGVIGALEQFSSKAPTDGQLEVQKQQIQTIESTSLALTTTVSDTGARQIEVLTRIDAALKKSQDAAELQLRQAGAANAELVIQLQKTNAKLAEIESRLALAMTSA